MSLFSTGEFGGYIYPLSSLIVASVALGDVWDLGEKCIKREGMAYR
jgi:hypothetical protein